MISFEWLEFETLSRESTDLEGRLSQAKSTKNHGLARILEQELQDVNDRRARTLDAITKKMASSAASAPAPISAPRPARAKRHSPALVEAEPEEAATLPKIEPDDEPADSDRPSPAAARFAAPMEGDPIVWDQLTPDHIEAAKRELARRRAEILARHAEELKALEADHEEIAALDKAIATFARKFNAAPEAAGEVVQLDEERQRVAVPA